MLSWNKFLTVAVIRWTTFARVKTENCQSSNSNSLSFHTRRHLNRLFPGRPTVSLSLRWTWTCIGVWCSTRMRHKLEQSENKKAVLVYRTPREAKAVCLKAIGCKSLQANRKWVVSYRWSIVTNHLSCTVSEIWRVTGGKMWFTYSTLVRPKFDKVALQICYRISK